MIVKGQQALGGPHPGVRVARVVAVVRRDKEFSTLARVTQPAMMLQVDNPLRVAGANAPSATWDFSAI